MQILTLDPPITVGDRTFVRYLDGHTYEDANGATLYSGANTPSEADAADCVENPRTPPAPAPAPHRILKDTIVQRVKAAAKLPELRGLIAVLDEDMRFEWDNSTWFSSDNSLLIEGLKSAHLDPAVILAPDPLAP